MLLGQAPLGTVLQAGPGVWNLIAVAWLGALVLLHAVFAFAVWKDALRRRTVLVGSFLWAFTTLLLGPVAAMGYWLLHASALAGGAPPSHSDPRRS